MVGVNEVKALVESAGGNLYGKIQTRPEDIPAAEEALNLKLPVEYIDFELTFGRLLVHGIEVYGLGPFVGTEDRPKGSLLKTAEVRAAIPSFPKSVLVIGYADGDAYWTLDCSLGKTRGFVQLMSAFQGHRIFAEFQSLWEYIDTKLRESIEDGWDEDDLENDE